MKYESKGEDRRQFQQEMHKIDKTHDILTELQRKMYSHFGKKASEDLLNSQDQQYKPPPPQLHPQKQTTKGKNTFKLFAKPNAQPMNINELEKQTPHKHNKQQVAKEKTQMGQIIQQVQTIELLVRKKLALKEQRIAQLERQISMQTEQKIHLYQINCKLQEEIDAAVKGNKFQKEKQAQQQKMMEEQLKRLTKVYQQKKKQNKRIRQQQDLLKQTLKNSHHHRKGCLQTEIQSKSRQKLVLKQDKHEEQYLRGLVIELDKLKNMVKQKMKKQKSKSKFK